MIGWTHLNSWIPAPLNSVSDQSAVHSLNVQILKLTDRLRSTKTVWGKAAPAQHFATSGLRKHSCFDSSFKWGGGRAMWQGGGVVISAARGWFFIRKVCGLTGHVAGGGGDPFCLPLLLLPRGVPFQHSITGQTGEVPGAPRGLYPFPRNYLLDNCFL